MCPRPRLLLSLALVASHLLSCTSDARSDGVVRVFAASSLTEAFGDLETSFEAAHPGVDVQLSFAGSQVLRLQLERGAQADVFASANPAHLEALREAGLTAPAHAVA